MSINYSVNEEEKATTAYLPHTRRDVEKVVKRVLEKNSKFFRLNDTKRIHLADVYKATVKANTELGDEFNEEVGKEEAKMKVINNYHNGFDKKAIAVLEDVANLFDALAREFSDTYHVDISVLFDDEYEDDTNYHTTVVDTDTPAL